MLQALQLWTKPLTMLMCTSFSHQYALGSGSTYRSGFLVEYMPCRSWSHILVT